MNQAIKTALLWFLGFWLFTWSLGLEFFRAIQVGFVGIVFSMVLVIILVLSDEYAKDVFFDIDDTPLEFQNWVHLFVGCIFDLIPIVLIFLAVIIALLKLPLKLT